MRIGLAVVLVVSIPTVAAANPITAGITLGLAEDNSAADQGADPNHTIGLFGRLGFNDRLSGQLEIQKVETDSSDTTIRSVTALLVVDLSSNRQFVPILVAGIGLDDASAEFNSNTKAHHFEGGLGFEFRSDAGFTLGIDVRMGGRSIDSQTNDLVPQGTIAFVAPTITAGEYRSARLALGVRF